MVEEKKYAFTKEQRHSLYWELCISKGDFNLKQVLRTVPGT